MKFIISFLLMAGLSYIAGIYLPWWSLAVIVFIVSVSIPQKPLISFICAFLALFILWAGLSYMISTGNGNILAEKVASLLLFTERPKLLILVTGIIGGLVAGFAGLAGSFLRYKKEIKY